MIRIESRWPECETFRAYLNTWNNYFPGFMKNTWLSVLIDHAHLHGCSEISIEAEPLPHFVAKEKQA